LVIKIVMFYFAAHLINLKRIDMSNVKEKITKIIVDKLGVDEDDLGADSLDTVELIMEFEKEFDISIPDESAEKIQTVGDAVTYLTEQTK